MLPSEPNPVYIVCDGSSSGGRGPGGWACLILNTLTAPDGHIISDSEQETTNSRMELMAVLRGLKFVARVSPGVKVVVITDSEYVINVVTGAKRAQANLDLVNDLKELYREGKVEFSWVRGHTSNTLHDIVDKEARREYLKAKETMDIL